MIQPTETSRQAYSRLQSEAEELKLYLRSLREQRKLMDFQCYISELNYFGECLKSVHEAMYHLWLNRHNWDYVLD